MRLQRLIQTGGSGQYAREVEGCGIGLFTFSWASEGDYGLILILYL